MNYYSSRTQYVRKTRVSTRIWSPLVSEPERRIVGMFFFHPLLLSQTHRTQYQWDQPMEYCASRAYRMSLRNCAGQAKTGEQHVSRMTMWWWWVFFLYIYIEAFIVVVVESAQSDADHKFRLMRPQANRSWAWCEEQHKKKTMFCIITARNHTTRFGAQDSRLSRLININKLAASNYIAVNLGAPIFIPPFDTPQQQQQQKLATESEWPTTTI